MKKQVLMVLSGLFVIVLMSGCTRQTPKLPDGQNAFGSDVILGDSDIQGGVDVYGKYTGYDGKSHSGINMLYFAYSSYILDSTQAQRVTSDLPKIRNLSKLGRIRIEGNCDEFGTDQFNYALGLKRAKSVKVLLVSNGIPASKISVVSYGESNPICRGKTPACHAKNRRVEINGAH